MIKKNQYLRHWLPVIIWLEVIFILSSIPGGVLSSMVSQQLQFWAHRSAHFVEYSVLGILVLRAYSLSFPKARIRVPLILFLAVFILLAGMFDEWHQSFVPGRTCSLLDASFDAICGALGMVGWKFKHPLQ